jgi:hypothetical protein
VRFRIAWNYPALVRFYDLHPSEATAVDRAVLRFAEAGEGHLSWVAPHHRLRAGAHDAVLAIDPAERVVTVLRIYRSRG